MSNWTPTDLGSIEEGAFVFIPPYTLGTIVEQAPSGVTTVSEVTEQSDPSIPHHYHLPDDLKVYEISD
jgi:hypothetical protein